MKVLLVQRVFLEVLWRELGATLIACARELTCRNIDGDVTAWFSRADLKLSDISGRIDVKNEFGDILLTATGSLSDKPHRLLSESGRVAVELTRRSLGQLPLQALTSCGTVVVTLEK